MSCTKTQKQRLVSVLAQLEAGPWQPAAGWQNERIIRNCECIASAGISSKNLPLACVAIHQLIERQPDTVRGTMYSVVSAGWLPDTSDISYGKIQRLLNVLRKKGVIPFKWIVDNIRSTEKPSSWSGLADFAVTVRDAYRRDFWASLPDYVAIIVEKDTVAGRIAKVTEEYDVPLHPLRGFSSTSFTYGIAEEWKQIEKPINVYYIGDFDPSGMQIEKSIRDALADYSGRDFSWQRLAVKSEHFQQHKIIPLTPKKKDTRYQKFIDEHGDRCAEVEAVPANVLRGMVEQAIKSHIPAAEWERLTAIENKERQSWREMIGKLNGAAA